MSRWLPRLFRAAPAPALAWGLDSRDLAWPADGGACASAPHAVALAQAVALLPSRARVDVVAGHDLAVHWLQTPPAAVASLQELQLVAAARCAHLYGGSPRDWWVAGDWSATRPFACAALPRAVTAPVQQALDASGARARWHTAWCVARADRTAAFPSDGWSALRTPQRVLLWHCRDGRVDCLASDHVGTDTTGPVAAERAQRLARLEALRDPSLPSGTLHWVSAGDAETAHGSEARAAQRMAQTLQPAISTAAGLRFAPPGEARPWFAGYAARHAGLARGALVLASALLAAAAWQAWHTASELGTARKTLEAAQRPGVTHVASAPGAAATLTAAQRTAWARIARQLNTPWGALLDALEASLPDDVALVAIEPDAAHESVRLQVEAKALDTLLAYAGELRSVPLFAQVNLVKHETYEHDASRPLRLGLNIRLRAQPGLATAPEGASR